MTTDGDTIELGQSLDSELARTRELLAASEARFRNIIENNADGVIVVLPCGRIAYANRAAEILLGRPARDLVQSPFGIPVVPGETTEIDIPGWSPSGQAGRVAELRVVETEWEHRPAILATLRDVTERKRAEESLRAAEERFRRISEATSDFSYSMTVDHDGTIRLEWLTEAFTRVTGYTVAEVRRDGWQRRIHPEDLPAVHLHFDRLLAGDADTCESRILTRDGRIRWIRHAARPLRDHQSNRVIRIFGAGQDVTDRRHLEQQLRERVEQLAENDRRKDLFLAMLAHELRNPLAPIRNAVEILRHPEAYPHLENLRNLIEQQVDVLSHLLEDLLDVSRITAGKITLRPAHVDLREVARRAVDPLRQFIAHHRLTIELRLPAQPVVVHADPFRIQQVVSNLLHNAVKYTDPGGSIAVEAAVTSDEEARLFVRDTGIGIAPNVIDRVFELFEQVDSSLDRARGGLGVGLTLARQIVQMHGGRLEATSAGLGKGSTFTMHLPLSAPEPTDDPPPTSPDPAGADVVTAQPPLRILVVDDNVESVRSLSLLLRLWGHEVFTAHDGPEALVAAQEVRPDAVLLDIGLPRMDGYEVAYRLRNDPRTQQSLIIAMTGYGQEDDRLRSRSAGFDHHLVKPLDLPQLERLLASPRPDPHTLA